MTTLAPAPSPRTRAASRARTRQQARRGGTVRVDLLPTRRPAPRRQAGAAGLRVAVFPLVVLAVLVGGGWQVGRAVVAAQPLTTTVTSPAVTASWGRLVVLGATRYDRTTAPAGGVVVDVVVRLVPTGGSGRFDPASVVLRRPDGREVPATLGALAPVRLPADGSVEGRLGFVTAPFDGTPVLV
ncbi:MAG: hypothetical protein HY830_10740, partial [Actinobacteria bacterium]|nr:hypothetical protein [Actinomycetota bacterium]